MSAVEGSCHCGAVRIALAAAPDVVTDCSCSICRRYGAFWAYYHPAQVQFLPADAATDTYLWGDRSLAFHRCRHCGCITHWSGQGPGPHTRMGINARMLDPAILAAAIVRHVHT